jgi:hypothetical protein
LHYAGGQFLALAADGLAAFTHCTIPDANFSSPTPRDLAAFT